MNNGNIVQISGPVVDVRFRHGMLPKIHEALSVSTDGGDRIMEVAQHIGNDMVLCVMLAPSDGLSRGMLVSASGGEHHCACG